MALGELILRLGTDDSALRAGLGRADATIRGFVTRAGSGLGGLGVQLAALAGGVGLGALGRGILQQADALDALSSRLSMPVEDITRLQFVASQTGADFDTLARAVTRFQVGLAGADDESSKLRAALTGLQIDPDQLLGKAPVDQFREVFAALSQIEDPIRRIGAIKGIFGERPAGELQKILAAGPEEFNRLLKQSDTIGATWSTSTVKKLDEVGDAFDRLSRVAGRALGDVAASLSQDAGVTRQLDDLAARLDGVGASFGAMGRVALAAIEGIYETGKELAGLFDRLSLGGLAGLKDIGMGAAGAAGSYLIGGDQGAQARDGAITTLLRGLTTIFGKPQAPETRAGPLIERGGVPVPLGGAGEFTINGKAPDPQMTEQNRILEEILRVQKARGTVAIAG
jgi:hypothetical protein